MTGHQKEQLQRKPEDDSVITRPEFRHRKAVKIQWDVDWEDDDEDVSLQSEMSIPDNIDDEDIADYLSDQTGFCHFGFDVVETDQEATARTRSYTDEELENLWLQFGNIPMDPESETMEDSFLDFPAGTHREDIWHWFDERYSKGVYALLYGK